MPHGSACRATWAGSSGEIPPERLDSAIIFAPVGALVPTALRAVKKGGRVIRGLPGASIDTVTLSTRAVGSLHRYSYPIDARCREPPSIQLPYRRALPGASIDTVTLSTRAAGSLPSDHVDTIPPAQIL